MNAPVLVFRVVTDEHDASPIGRLYQAGRLSRDEFEQAKKWRGMYLNFLSSIGAPGYCTDEAYSDEECERLKARVDKGIHTLTSCVGRRSFHAINSLAVYEEPEELGDFEFTVAAAKLGLAHLVRIGF